MIRSGSTRTYFQGKIFKTQAITQETDGCIFLFEQAHVSKRKDASRAKDSGDKQQDAKSFSPSRLSQQVQTDYKTA